MNKLILMVGCFILVLVIPVLSRAGEENFNQGTGEIEEIQKKVEARLIDIGLIDELAQETKQDQLILDKVKKAQTLYGQSKNRLDEKLLIRAHKLIDEADEIMEEEGVRGLLFQLAPHLYAKEQILHDVIVNELSQKKFQVTDWNKVESMGYERKKSVRWGWRLLNKISKIIIHHTDTKSLKEIYEKHTAPGHFDTQGAPFIAYHFLILPDGEVLWLNPLQDKVWHAKGANLDSIGIALLGNFVEKPPTSSQIKSAIMLVSVLQKSLRLSQKAVYGHQEEQSSIKKTQCPGIYGMRLVEVMKQ